MSCEGWSQHWGKEKKKKEVILLVFRSFTAWKTARMPLLISKDSHYSIFSPGTDLSLSERCWEGWWMEQALRNSHKSPHTLPQFRKAPPHPLKTRIYQLFSELAVLSYSFACSAYLDWVPEVFLCSRRSLGGGRGWSWAGAAVQVTLGQPSSSPWAAAAAAAEPTLCLMHAFILHVIPLRIIDRNTSSYITMLMCPCAGENASSTLGSQGSQTASSSGENLCWGEADQAKNTSSLWHCLSWWDCLGENKDGTLRSEWNKWV